MSSLKIVKFLWGTFCLFVEDPTENVTPHALHLKRWLPDCVLPDKRKRLTVSVGLCMWFLQFSLGQTISGEGARYADNLDTSSWIPRLLLMAGCSWQRKQNT